MSSLNVRINGEDHISPSSIMIDINMGNHRIFLENAILAESRNKMRNSNIDPDAVFEAILTDVESGYKAITRNPGDVDSIEIKPIEYVEDL